MIDDYLAGKCPFCDPLDPDKNKVIAQTEDLRMWKNPFPLDKAKLHLIMATTQHRTSVEELTAAANFRDIGRLFTDACYIFAIDRGKINDWEGHFIAPHGVGSVQFVLNPNRPRSIPTVWDGVTINEHGRWTMGVNAFPFPHTTIQMLLAVDSRMDDSSFGKGDFEDIGVLFAEFIDAHKIKGGGLILANQTTKVAFAMRFGSPEFSAGSVLHQHANIIVADENPVGITLAKDESKIVETVQRMHGFEHNRLTGRTDDLDPAIQLLLEGRMS